MKSPGDEEVQGVQGQQGGSRKKNLYGGRKHKSKKGGKTQEQQGGGGAAEFGVSAFGGIGEQNPKGGNGNAISISGGSRRKKTDKKKGGKSIFADLAIPAGFLFAQQKFSRTRKSGGKRSSKKNVSRKN